MCRIIAFSQRRKGSWAKTQRIAQLIDNGITEFISRNPELCPNVEEHTMRKTVGDVLSGN